MQKLHSMTSMAFKEEDTKSLPFPIALNEKPDYPYGLRICLTEKELSKLDLDPSSAEVGGIVHMHAIARITHVSHTDSPMGYDCRIEVQIEDLCVESEDEENSEEEKDEY